MDDRVRHTKMGKGTGNNNPRKFIGDQYFCEVCIFAFLAASITLSSMSIGMDDGGTFPYQYAYSGFVLAPILLVNLISRIYVVHAVEKKGLTRKNIIEILSKTTIGSIIWPWSCRVGMMWCIPGTILSGIGGVNCGIDKDNNTVKVRNNCYYDINGEHADMYKGLAVGLVILHIFSFVYLLLSNCPVHTVLEQIKEDPKPARNARRQQNTTSSTTPSASGTTPAASGTTVATVASSNGRSNESDLTTTMQRLEARIQEIENRERTAQASGFSGIVAPPSYSQLMAESIEKNSGAHPV